VEEQRLLGELETLRLDPMVLHGHDPEELVEILVQRYPEASTIGWHRDAPAVGTVVGVWLGGSSRLRFERGKRSITLRTLRDGKAP
jgi:hypothetical protein